MNGIIRRVLRTAAITALLGALAHPAAAQERPAPVAELHLGSLLFPDNSVVRENFIGGAARFYVLPRISLGPEVAYVGGERHTHLMLTANMTFDLLGPENGRPARVSPFLVGGGGLFRTRERFPREDFTHDEGAFTAGGGVRAQLGDVVTIGAEARVGWELHLRLNALVGIRLGK